MATRRLKLNGDWVVGEVVKWDGPTHDEPWWNIEMDDGRVFSASGNVVIEEDPNGDPKSNQNTKG